MPLQNGILQKELHSIHVYVHYGFQAYLGEGFQWLLRHAVKQQYMTQSLLMAHEPAQLFEAYRFSHGGSLPFASCWSKELIVAVFSSIHVARLTYAYFPMVMQPL